MPKSKLWGPLLWGNVWVPLPAEPYWEPKKAIIEETVVLRKEIPMWEYEKWVWEGTLHANQLVEAD